MEPVAKQLNNKTLFSNLRPSHLVVLLGSALIVSGFVFHSASGPNKSKDGFLTFNTSAIQVSKIDEINPDLIVLNEYTLQVTTKGGEVLTCRPYQDSKIACGKNDKAVEGISLM